MNSTDTQPRARPTIIPRSDHNISRANVSSNALKVLYRLKNAGFSAFLVGGGVRDLLLERHPKDFDVVTDALPEDVSELFRNCRLIGRRFRLAHVRFGRDVVEVATFRAASSEEEHEDREHSETGRILRDNVYGTIDEDIWRRDFTVNALYYNIADFTVWDYTTGLEDIKHRTLRLIGDPVTRYREDPVRMLRAVRLAAKLDFSIAPEAAKPISELAELLRDVPAARLFDEVLKLFHAGHALKSFELLRQYGLFKYLFPETAAVLQGEEGEAALEFIREGLRNTDARVHEDKPVTPTFLFAVFLWPVIKRLAADLEKEGLSPTLALAEAAHRAVGNQQQHTTFPKRFSIPMKEILAMQPRFESRRGPRGAKLLEHKRFRAAYDFLLLRSRFGEVPAETAEWWTKVQELPAEEQRQAFGTKRRRSNRRRRGGRRDSAAQAEPRESVH
ncbi:MAG TPA: polynucleotide adenylyltransferase PcnB [Gammaproteobacteria bacterium]|nr:polynucleotide adenylyltransferase PcnB [Gammaproteobacteria bacterium]